MAWSKLTMKTAGWHQRGGSSEFILKLKKKVHLTILSLDKWTPDGGLLFEELLPNQVT